MSKRRTDVAADDYQEYMHEVTTAAAETVKHTGYKKQP